MYYVEVRGEVEINQKEFINKSSAINHATKLFKKFVGGSKHIQIIVASGNTLERVISLDD